MDEAPPWRLARCCGLDVVPLCPPKLHMLGVCPKWGGAEGVGPSGRMVRMVEMYCGKGLMFSGDPGELLIEQAFFFNLVPDSLLPPVSPCDLSLVFHRDATYHVPSWSECLTRAKHCQ
jgi:hypothetical protein